MDEDKKDCYVIYTHPIKSIFPNRVKIASSTMPLDEFNERYLSFLNNDIGQLFYPVEIGKDDSNGMLNE